jgi:hypothetical protein
MKNAKKPFDTQTKYIDKVIYCLDTNLSTAHSSSIRVVWPEMFLTKDPLFILVGYHFCDIWIYIDYLYINRGCIVNHECISVKFKTTKRRLGESRTKVFIEHMLTYNRD